VPARSPPEQQDDAAVGDEDAGQAPDGEPVTGNEEMREHDGVDRVEVEHHGAVRRAGQRRADVHQADLRREDSAQNQERSPLVAREREAGQPAGEPAPQRDDQAAHEKAHPGQPQRRGVEQTQLDCDRVATPEERHEQREGGARRIDPTDGVAQSGARSGVDSEAMDRRPL
jgi:hypothetical protein